MAEPKKLTGHGAPKVQVVARLPVYLVDYADKLSPHNRTEGLVAMLDAGRERLSAPESKGRKR
ncbi:MAG TPA: hypothetical protein VFP50_15490 [Anaeromyxobacteraceae bacterium]|nr:hypothetical protein [Anaeromyxobacteraceae bacterium]